MPAPHRSVFLQAECPSCRPTNSVKALKAHMHINFIVNRVKATSIHQQYQKPYNGVRKLRWHSMYSRLYITVWCPSVCLSVNLSVRGWVHSSKLAAAGLPLLAQQAGDIDWLLHCDSQWPMDKILCIVLYSFSVVTGSSFFFDWFMINIKLVRSSTTCSWSEHYHKSKVKYTDIANCSLTCHTATGTHMPHGLTQCYLPPGRGDIPVFTPAEAGTRLSDPGGMQGWVDLVGLLHTEMVYLPEDGHQPKY